MPLSESLFAKASRTLSRNVYVVEQDVARRAITLLVSHFNGKRPHARVGNGVVDTAKKRVKGEVQFVIQTWPNKAPKVFVAVNHRDSFEIVEELVIDQNGVRPEPPTRKWSIPKTGRFSYVDELI